MFKNQESGFKKISAKSGGILITIIIVHRFLYILSSVNLDTKRTILLCLITNIVALKEESIQIGDHSIRDTALERSVTRNVYISCAQWLISYTFCIDRQ